MRNLHRNAEPGPENAGAEWSAETAQERRRWGGMCRSRAGMRTLCRRGICAGNAESGACAKTRKRNSEEAAGTDGPASAFPGAVRGFLPESGTGRRSVAKTASAFAFRRFSGRVSMQGVVLSGDWLRERASLCEEKSPKEAARRFLRSAHAGIWRRLFSAERQDSSGGRRLLQKAAGRRRRPEGGTVRGGGRQRRGAERAVFPDGRGEGQRCPVSSCSILRAAGSRLFAERRADAGTGTASLSMGVRRLKRASFSRDTFFEAGRLLNETGGGRRARGPADASRLVLETDSGPERDVVSPRCRLRGMRRRFFLVSPWKRRRRFWLRSVQGAARFCGTGFGK